MYFFFFDIKFPFSKFDISIESFRNGNEKLDEFELFLLGR